MLLLPYQVIANWTDLQSTDPMPNLNWKSLTPAGTPIRWTLILLLGAVVAPPIVIDSARGLIHRNEGATAVLLVAMGAVLVASAVAMLINAYRRGQSTTVEDLSTR